MSEGKKKKVQKVKLSLEYSWVITGAEWEESEDFRKNLPDNILWDGVPINDIIEQGKDDPIFMFHQLTDMGHPDDFHVTVEPAE